MGRDPRIGATLAGYHIESLLGRGGMSVVYLAEHVALGRKVALKFLTMELAENQAFRDRFVRESRLAASLDHPNIIPIYEAGEAAGELFIAMRYVRGTDLRRLLDAHGPLSPERTVALASQVAGALDAAHEEGLVHRDVKPANVLIDNPPGRGRSEHVYLSDFGLTKRKLSGSGPTGTGQLVGTIDYVAPEQIRSEPVDGRVDVYSLGCMVFECLTGEVPFDRDSEMAVLWAHVQEPPPRPTALRPELPAEVDDIVARAMAKAPGDRYPSAGELSEALAATLPAPPRARAEDAEPRMAQPGKEGEVATPGRTRPTGRLVRAVSAAALSIALIVGGTLFVRSRHSPATNAGGGPSAGGPVSGSTPESILMGLYRIDPLSGDVDKPLPGAVYGVAVAEGFVWVVDSGGIRKINPDTNKEIASLPIGNNVLDIEAGEGAVWAERRDGGRLVLYRVDPRTNDFRKIPAVSIQEPFGASFLTTKFTVADGAVWLPDLRNEALIHVDASTLAVRRFDLPPGTAGVVAGEHQLWVRDNGARASVSRLDPATGEVIHEITLAGGADGLAIGGGFVYVADTTNDIVVQIDPVTNTAFRTIQVGDGPRDLAFGDGFLWVVNRSGGTVSKVDPRTYQEVDTIAVPATGGIAVGEEAVWVASCGRLLIETTCQ